MFLPPIEKQSEKIMSGLVSLMKFAGEVIKLLEIFLEGCVFIVKELLAIRLAVGRHSIGDHGPWQKEFPVHAHANHELS